MRTAILGFPQSGKTALFKALCGPQVHAEAYGAHVGVARVPDPRLDALAKIFQPKKTSYVALEFVDAPGLLNDPEKDAGVFGQVRGAEAFAHVVRVFGEDVNPARDLEQLETEFLVVDLDTVTKRLEKVTRDMKKIHTPEIEHERALLERARAVLAANQPLRAAGLSAEEERALRGFMLLSAKPVLAVLNVGDDDAPRLEEIPHRYNLDSYRAQPGVAVTEICGKIESELAELEATEAAEFLVSYGLKEPARDRVLHTLYQLLGFITFFTVAENECRAWAAPPGTVAVDAAGMVHSDFARRFIKAEVAPWKELVECGGLAAARDKGRVRLEGKEYKVHDGDVLYIRHTA
ncbi:MAG TPA: DUF933 domain-containing protein [Candidatus Xenobia bacterium]|nr:DUF933 domain-containing protein [Candidatus Xenobia bacterium]